MNRSRAAQNHCPASNLEGRIYYQITGTEGEITLPAVVSLPEGTVIGCVGDSTTYGSGVMKNRDTESYPALLQDLLGDSIAVENYGMGSQTVMPGTDAPYREHSIYRTSQKEPCDFYIIMMGTMMPKTPIGTRSSSARSFWILCRIIKTWLPPPRSI